MNKYIFFVIFFSTSLAFSQNEQYFLVSVNYKDSTERLVITQKERMKLFELDSNHLYSAGVDKRNEFLHIQLYSSSAWSFIKAKSQYIDSLSLYAKKYKGLIAQAKQYINNQTICELDIKDSLQFSKRIFCHLMYDTFINDNKGRRKTFFKGVISDIRNSTIYLKVKYTHQLVSNAKLNKRCYHRQPIDEWYLCDENE